MQYQQLPIFLVPNMNPKIILTHFLEVPKVSHEKSGAAVLCFYGPTISWKYFFNLAFHLDHLYEHYCYCFTLL